jgi:Response regulator
MYPTVHIVDDDPSFRNAIARLLRMKGYEVNAYESAAVFLTELPEITVGCIVLDVKMPDLSGLQLQEQLLKMKFPIPIIFLSGRGDIAMGVHAIKAGAVDFLTKPVNDEALFNAIEQALLRHKEMFQQNKIRVKLKELIEKLTPRERQVFSLLIQGQMNKQIAFVLGTAERTIKAHRQSIMKKLQARSVSELVLIAERLALSGEPNVNVVLPPCLKAPQGHEEV